MCLASFSIESSAVRPAVLRHSLRQGFRCSYGRQAQVSLPALLGIFALSGWIILLSHSRRDGECCTTKLILFERTIFWR